MVSSTAKESTVLQTGRKTAATLEGHLQVGRPVLTWSEGGALCPAGQLDSKRVHLDCAKKLAEVFDAAC
jgi:hypothetical protein